VLAPPVLVPGAPPASGGVAVKEFRRICTKANLATCAPKCLALTNGFLLSIEIDGRGTTMTVGFATRDVYCRSHPLSLSRALPHLSKNGFWGPKLLTLARRAQCIRNGQIYSWQGQAALGGFIGDDFDSFFSSVVSGAAGAMLCCSPCASCCSCSSSAQPVHAPMIMNQHHHYHLLRGFRRRGWDTAAARASG
jgi:hypothetical protein